VRQLGYLAMLALVLLGTLPLELRLGTRVFSRWRRLLLSLLPVLIVFVGWDVYAVARGHWAWDPEQTVGVVLPGGLPVEELLFFLVVPTAAILTLEAVRAVRGWPVGDEPRHVSMTGGRD
jgi:lycopene cyclase domain-containing protein